MSEAAAAQPKSSTVLAPLVALIVIAVIALVVGVILGVAALRVDTYNYFSGGISSSALAQQTAMTTWSNFLLIITVVSGVGAVVLAGVQILLRRAGYNV